jgi:ankyrin repeat protein
MDKFTEYFTSHPNQLPPTIKSFLCGLTDQTGNSLFHWAAKAQAMEMAVFLYQIGCDYNRGNFQNSTPFLWAATNQSLNPQEYLEYKVADMLRAEQFEKEMRLYEEYEKEIEFTKSQNRNPDETNNPSIPTKDHTYTTNDLDSPQNSDNQPQPSPQSDTLPKKIHLSDQTPSFTNRSKESSRYLNFTRIDFNPMLELLYIFAYNDDSNQFKNDLYKRYGIDAQNGKITSNQTSNTLLSQYHSTIQSQLNRYDPNSIPSSRVYRLINHQNIQGENAMHFASTFLSVSSVKTLIYLSSSPMVNFNSRYPSHTNNNNNNDPISIEQQQLLHQQLMSLPIMTQITTESRNTPLHLLPQDCLEQEHCRKIATILILLGYDPKAQNRYKRSLEHHIKFETITPLLDIEEEWVLSRFRRVPLNDDLKREFRLKYQIEHQLEGFGLVKVTRYNGDDVGEIMFGKEIGGETGLNGDINGKEGEVAALKRERDWRKR